MQHNSKFNFWKKDRQKGIVLCTASEKKNAVCLSNLVLSHHSRLLWIQKSSHSDHPMKNHSPATALCKHIMKTHPSHTSAKPATAHANHFITDSSQIKHRCCYVWQQKTPVTFISINPSNRNMIKSISEAQLVIAKVNVANLSVSYLSLI